MSLNNLLNNATHIWNMKTKRNYGILEKTRYKHLGDYIKVYQCKETKEKRDKNGI